MTTGVAPYERTQLPYWIADTISVSDVSTENATAYDVTIETLECFHNMQLLAFEFGDVDGQSVSAAGSTVIQAPAVTASTCLWLLPLWCCADPICTLHAILMVVCMVFSCTQL